MVPVIALVGRPNVGKSTLFNQITRTRDALVANYPGLTRDRKYGEARHNGRRCIVIDTGGISGDEEGIDAEMARQSLQAIEEADDVLFLVDAKAGLTSADQMIANHLRRTGKNAHLVINKVDGHDPDIVSAEFHELGMGSIFQIAAVQNRGVRSMLDQLLPEQEALSAGIDPVDEEGSVLGDDAALLASAGDEETADAATETDPAEVALSVANRGIRICVVGRPNVGKSTLVNRMLGEERVIVFDHPGTTRDSIYIPFERHGKEYTLIDTAGIRRRKNVEETVEKFSIIKTLQAIDDAHVVIMVIDAREGLVDQDLHLIGFVLDAGRSLIIAVNKWDGMAPDERRRVKEQLTRRLSFLDYAAVHFISALHGSGVGVLFDDVGECYASAMAKWSTNRLTTLLEDIISQHQPPLVNGRRIKLRYAHQGGSNPPIIVVHGNQTESIPATYKRYLENMFRKVLGVVGTPIRFEFKSGENPYADKVNKLTPRQEYKRSRMKDHIIKSKKNEKKNKGRKR